LESAERLKLTSPSPAAKLRGRAELPKDRKKLLTELGQLESPAAYFRAHSLLMSGDGAPSLSGAPLGLAEKMRKATQPYNWAIASLIPTSLAERHVHVRSPKQLRNAFVVKEGFMQALIDQ
jgi:hypothetical protein